MCFNLLLGFILFALDLSKSKTMAFSVVIQVHTAGVVHSLSGSAQGVFVPSRRRKRSDGHRGGTIFWSPCLTPTFSGLGKSATSLPLAFPWVNPCPCEHVIPSLAQVSVVSTLNPGPSEFMPVVQPS